jgi:hypothetical protein
MPPDRAISVGLWLRTPGPGTTVHGKERCHADAHGVASPALSLVRKLAVDVDGDPYSGMPKYSAHDVN